MIILSLVKHTYLRLQTRKFEGYNHYKLSRQYLFYFLYWLNYETNGSSIYYDTLIV